MRPARFFFGLLFAAVFVITLMKILFFGLIAAAIFGSIFFLSRSFRRHRRDYYGRPGYLQYENSPWQQPFPEQDKPNFAQPLDPNWQPRRPSAPVGRRIEVL